MAQFDVYRFASRELVLDCQADVVSILQTRLVVPLLNPAVVPDALKSLHPLFEVEGRELLMATHLATAVGRNELGEPLLSLEHRRYEILNALDFLISGV